MRGDERRRIARLSANKEGIDAIRMIFSRALDAAIWTRNRSIHEFPLANGQWRNPFGAETWTPDRLTVDIRQRLQCTPINSVCSNQQQQHDASVEDFFIYLIELSFSRQHDLPRKDSFLFASWLISVSVDNVFNHLLNESLTWSNLTCHYWTENVREKSRTEWRNWPVPILVTSGIRTPGSVRRSCNACWALKAESRCM